MQPPQQPAWKTQARGAPQPPYSRQSSNTRFPTTHHAVGRHRHAQLSGGATGDDDAPGRAEGAGVEAKHFGGQGQRIFRQKTRVRGRTKTFLFFGRQSRNAHTPNSPPPPRWPTRTLLPRCVAGTNAASALVCHSHAHRPIAFGRPACFACLHAPACLASHTGSSTHDLPIACGGGRKAPVENGADCVQKIAAVFFALREPPLFLTRRTHPQAFVDHYYTTFDTNRQALGGLYQVSGKGKREAEVFGKNINRNKGPPPFFSIRPNPSSPLKAKSCRGRPPSWPS